jgi:Protein of unknown function (DUF3237)
MELVHEFTFTASLKEPVAVGPGPFGDRNFFEITDGKVTGERLSGTVRAGGGDWILACPDGYGRLDVRGIFETDDGANVYVQYYGVVEYTDAVVAAVTGERSCDYHEQYFRTSRDSSAAILATRGSTRPCSWARDESMSVRWSSTASTG